MFLRVFGGSNGSFIWRGYAWDSWWAVTSGGIWHPNGMSLDLRQDFTSIAVAKWWALKMWTCWTPFYHISTFFHDFNQVLLSAIVIAHHLMDLHDIVQMDCKTFGPSFGQLISCDGRHSTKKTAVVLKIFESPKASSVQTVPTSKMHHLIGLEFPKKIA